MAAFEEQFMAKRSKSPVKTGADSKRFGVKANVPLSSVEMGRITRAQKKRQEVTQKGGTYYSPYDTATSGKGGKGLEEEAYESTKQEIKQDSQISGGGGGETALDRYVRGIQGLLQSGEYLKPQEQLKEQLQTMYGQAQTGVNTAMDNLQSFLEKQVNPYEGFKAQAAQVSPQLMEFLQSQGASTDPLQQLAAVRQQEATNQAAAFQNLGDTLKTLAAAQQSGRIGDVAQQRASYQSALEGAKAGYGTQLDQASFNRRNELLKLILAGMGKGGRPGAGSIVGVGPSGLGFPQAQAPQPVIPDLGLLIPGMGSL